MGSSEAPWVSRPWRRGKGSVAKVCRRNCWSLLFHHRHKRCVCVRTYTCVHTCETIESSCVVPTPFSDL